MIQFRKRCAVGPVDDAVVVRERQREDQPRLQLAIDIRRDALGAPEAEHAELRPVDDRREVPRAEGAEVGDRERTAARVLDGELAVAGTLRCLREVDRELDDVLLVDVADNRHDQPALGVDRRPHVDVALEDQFAADDIDAGVHAGVGLECPCHDLQQHDREREVAAGLGGARLEALAHGLELRHVRRGVQRDVRDLRPRVRHVARDRATEARERLALDRPPLAEVRERWRRRNARRGLRGGRCRSGLARRTSALASVALHVVLVDAPTRSGARHLRDVDADLARERADRGRRERRASAVERGAFGASAGSRGGPGSGSALGSGASPSGGFSCASRASAAGVTGASVCAASTGSRPSAPEVWPPLPSGFGGTLSCWRLRSVLLAVAPCSRRLYREQHLPDADRFAGGNIN